MSETLTAPRYLRDMGRAAPPSRAMRPQAGTLAKPEAEWIKALMGQLFPDSSVAVTESTSMGIATVFACVRYIAMTMANLPLKLYRKSGETREEADRHPLTYLVRTRPNGAMTPFDLRATQAAHFALHGNSFSQILRSRGGQPSELWPIHPRLVREEMDWKVRLPKYMIQGTGNDSMLSENQTLLWNEVLHLRNLSFDGLSGLSPLGCAAPVIALAQCLETSARKFFANGARPGVAITWPPGVAVTPEQVTKMRQQFEEMHGGVDNFSKPLFLSGNAKIEVLRHTNEQSEADAFRMRTAYSVCSFFGVPPHKVGLLDRATFSNIEEQQIQAVVDLIGPISTSIEQAYAGALLTPEEIRAGYFFKHDLRALMRGNDAARGGYYNILMQNGIISRNEVRKLEDMEPVEGGDEILVPLNMVPLSQAIDPPDKPAPSPNNTP